MPQQSRLSTLEYRRVITTTDGSDITADSVSFAFMEPGSRPADADWHAATYEGTDTNTWHVLVGPGPGGLALAVGQYDVWQKVIDAPEIYGEHVDTIEIT